MCREVCIWGGVRFVSLSCTDLRLGELKHKTQ